MWDAVKPPPPVQGVKKPMTAQRRKQRRMILIALAVFVLVGLGWAVYGYMAAAPQRAQANFDDAENLMSSGHYADAVKGFTRAVEILPSMANAYVERGVAEHNLGEDEPALADFDRALGLDPNLSLAYATRGSISRDRGDVGRAMEEYTKSIQAKRMNLYTLATKFYRVFLNNR